MSVVAGTPRLRALAAGLKEARTIAGLSTRELAIKLKWAQPTVSHFELGRRRPSVEQVAMIVAVLGVDRAERERLIELARRADEPNWLTTGVPGISQQLAGVFECEAAATRIVEWSPNLVPGLLQSPEYAEAIMKWGRDEVEDLPTRIMIRIGRQQVIARPENPVRFVALIGENTLHDPVVSAALMADQLRHLAEMAERPNVEIRIVPSRIGWHPGSSGPFVFYEFADSGPVVHFEHYSSGAFVPDAENVRDYRQAIEVLTDLALTPDESIAAIARAADEWKGNHDEHP
ncbi:MAG TPA: helix-turn-helix transcriptional regulator [Pseudonocardiaceae bacterium]